MGNIITSQVVSYLNSLYRPLSPFLAELRESAEKRSIPIILRDTESFLRSLLTLKKPGRILEVGTAVGYSALFFAQLLPECRIVTLELSPQSCQAARENIRRAGAGFEARISVICGDARETLADLAGGEGPGTEGTRPESGPFDFVFLDGGKGHYLEFWNGCLPLCRPGTLIVSDNVLYQGITASEEFLTSRRDKTIMRRMRSFLEEITCLEWASTSVLAVGDGLAVTILKESFEMGLQG